MKQKHIETDGGRLGFAPNEKLDCTVRALALAAQISYCESHAKMKRAGRKDGRRMPGFEKFMRGLSGTICNGRYVQRSGDCGATLGAFIAARPTGRYLVGIRGHVVAIVDGVALDLGEPKWRSIVKSAWCFEVAICTDQ